MASRGDICATAASFNSYIQKETDNLSTPYNRGFALLKAGDLPWALEDIDFVLAKDPRHKEVLPTKNPCLAHWSIPGFPDIATLIGKGSAS